MAAAQQKGRQRRNISNGSGTGNAPKKAAPTKRGRRGEAAQNKDSSGRRRTGGGERKGQAPSPRGSPAQNRYGAAAVFVVPSVSLNL